MSTNVKMASEAQISLYNRLADLKAKAMEEKKVARASAEELVLLTSKQLSDKINYLQTLVVTFAITDGQRDLITKLVGELGMQVPPMLDKFSSAQASEFIGKLNNFKASRPALATDKQKERIKLYLEAKLIEADKVDFTKLSKKDASDIIDAIDSAYKTYRDTHVTDKQIEFIQSLQERLGDAVIPKEELAVMTRDTASALIDQLQKEWNDRDAIAKQAVSNYKDLTDRSKEREDLLKLTIGQREFEEKQEMLAKLFVLIGQEPEGIETIGFDAIDNMLGEMVSMARMYVEDGAIIEALGLQEIADVIPPVVEETVIEEPVVEQPKKRGRKPKAQPVGA